MITVLNRESTINILVFKTDIRFSNDVTKVAPALNSQPAIRRWNIDRSDIDKVLRIESDSLQVQDIIGLVQQAGYHCEELPD
ncbi:hypothetical protein F0L74_05555 [Chitinophaga agrisoli]|uniref:Copper chaperone CopZ n=1 Tax=Chitinophaga agrisoli TaxID=2607653 RepID=A0A5B2W4S6_9BACT|nr:hypothetical protein [Chitinophaga agrisoli]KAA2245427.1 hypothetical protein F0L74_05555 [Chitinophaga agrisoli]